MTLDKWLHVAIFVGWVLVRVGVTVAITGVAMCIIAALWTKGGGTFVFDDEPNGGGA